MASVREGVDEWIRLYLNSCPTSRPQLVDVRPTQHFIANHVEQATHFPGLTGTDGLFERTNELPPPQNRSNIALLATTSEESLFAARSLSSKLKTTVIALTMDDVIPFLPLQRGPVSRPLWQPAPILVQFFPQIIHQLPSRTALDIGAGSGRDAAWLAYHGFIVKAVDRDSKLTRKCIRLATQSGYNAWFQGDSPSNGSVSAITRTFGAHLKDDLDFLRENASGLLLIVRFLRRGVLEQLWQAVLPGGYVFYEHFLLGCEHYPDGPRSQSQMLRPGELNEIFSPKRGFSCLADIQCHLSDGRPVTRFVARRLLRD